MMGLPDDTSLAETEALLRQGVRCALESTEFSAAVERYRELLPQIAPSMLARLPPGEETRRTLAHLMLREIWNVLPRPDNDWRPRTLPKPERNAPCPCGSGRKYKQCCGQMADVTPFGGEGLSVLAYVLERIPADRYRELPFKRLSPEELGHVASQWIEAARHDQAVALLEPLLERPERLDERHEYAFDMLCTAYLELGESDKRNALVTRMMRVPDRALKSAAMHRRCTMFADEGEYDAAWALFKQALRADPDNPSLAHLEVLLLMSEDKIEEAQDRARFWANRLKRLGFEGEPIVDMLTEFAHDPSRLLAAFRAASGDGPESPRVEDVRRLMARIDTLPSPEPHYRLRPDRGDAGPLTPEPALGGVEDRWQAVFGDTGADEEEDDDLDPWIDTRWLDWLDTHPLALQSFRVLEDMYIAIGDCADEDFAFDDEAFLDALERAEDLLLDYAVGLLRINLSANGADGCRLDWGWTENRAALRLLGERIDSLQDSGDRLPLLEWLVLTLNPNDNQGYREKLVHVYLERGRPADALALCERYPNDSLATTLYARVLALYLLQRDDEAAAALGRANKQVPHVIDALLAKRARPPEFVPGSTHTGGEDEAWVYRQRWRELWERTGALAWLRRSSKRET